MPHDEEINSLPGPTLVWMAAMINKDEEEKLEKELAFTEYLASFINPEAVQEVKQKRNPQHISDDESFRRAIESISGKPAPQFEE